MKLIDIFSMLALGELEQTNMVDGGCILPHYYPKLISHINLALTDLHSRFPLKTKEVFITESEGINTYVLNSRYAESNTESTEPVKYIADVRKTRFVDDVLQIQSVYNEIGEELYVNDNSAEFSVYLPDHLSVQLLLPVEGNTFSVIYRADHPKINLKADPYTTEVDLPFTFLKPLLFYVAGRSFAGMNAPDQWNTGMLYESKYNVACDELIHRGIFNTDQSGNQHFEERGWV